MKSLTIQEIGCCGAYCKTCIQWQKDKYPNERACLGCKLGYSDGKRDLGRAKCKIKICCFGKRKHETCADCIDYPCEVVMSFYSKNGSKYIQYRRQVEFIRENGYVEFIKLADRWKGPHGKLK